MNITAKARLLLEHATALAARGASWPDFSNEIFDQTRGLVVKTFPTGIERQAFYDTPQYTQLHAIMSDLMKAQGLAAAPKSGKFVVRVPKTLHEVLDVEARREGVSLNQLVVAKLAFPLREKARLDARLIVRAFADVCDGYATDRVVVDPDLDPKYLYRCRELGLTATDYMLNHALFDVRKSGKADLPSATRPTVFRDVDDYGYGAEIAVRILQKTHGVSLDRILCDPELIRSFDDLSGELVRERSILKRRWAALNLRKSRRLRPTDLSGPMYKLVSCGPVAAIPLADIPASPATYVFYESNRPLFAGETDNLQRRMELHRGAREVSSGLDLSGEGVVLKQFSAPNLVPTDRQRWLRQFINCERPLLNYQRTA